MQILVSRASLPFRSLPGKNNTGSQKYFGNSVSSWGIRISIVIILDGTPAYS